MANIVFACISPHPPLLLPAVGSDEDKALVRKTIRSLEQLGKRLQETGPDQIIISAPHPDWGFNVPLHFLAPHFPGEIKCLITGLESPHSYFKRGQTTFKELEKDKRYALIASGDLSHCLKERSPYGFHPDGPKFDQYLIKFLGARNIKNLLKLDEMFPNAGECGLRSFLFLLGILDASKMGWKPKILSYEAPFGVGYLVVEFQLKSG